jgi:pyruvate kinase
VCPLSGAGDQCRALPDRVGGHHEPDHPRRRTQLRNGSPLNHVPHAKRGVLACAARDIGERLEAKALVAFTQSGDTARRLARLHTRLPLLAFTPEPGVRNQLALSWGIEPFLVPQVQTTDAMVGLVD